MSTTSLDIKSIADLKEVAFQLREEKALDHKIRLERYNIQAAKFNLIHKALYDHGAGSEASNSTLANLKLGSSEQSAFSKDQREDLAIRGFELLMQLCTVYPDQL